MFGANARARHESGYGPTPTTWAMQQVVGYLGYSGRHAPVVVTAALDRLPPFPIDPVRAENASERPSALQAESANTGYAGPTFVSDKDAYLRAAS